MTSLLDSIFPTKVFKSIIPVCKSKNCKSLHVDLLVDNIIFSEVFSVDDILIHLAASKNGKLRLQTKQIEEELLKQVAKRELKLNLLAEEEIFPEEEIKLNDLERKIEELTVNDFLLGKKIRATIDARINHLEKEKRINYNDNNLASKFLRDSTYQAFLMQHQITDLSSLSYLLVPCPRNIYHVGDLFQLLLSNYDQSIDCNQVIVSLFTQGEKDKFDKNTLEIKGKYIDNYWEKDILSNVPLRHGWHYSLTSFVSETKSSKNLNNINFTKEESKENKQPKKNKRRFNSCRSTPSLTEKKILFCNINGKKKEISHLHFNGWLDQTQCEDEELMMVLLDRIEELSPWRLTLGCHHSRSRSATLLLAHLLRQEIRSTYFNEKRVMNSLGEIKINVPEIILKFRSQRLEFMRRPCQLINLFSLTNKFVQRLTFIESSLSKILGNQQDQSGKVVRNILSFF
jgi:protein tyrosine phosphatase